MSIQESLAYTNYDPTPCGDVRIRSHDDFTREAKGIGAFCLFDQNSLTPETLNDIRVTMALRAAETYKVDEADETGESKRLSKEDADAVLDMIYPAAHEACATRSLVKEHKVAEKIGDAQFAILAVKGNDPRSVAARRLEAKVFYETFGTHPADHELSHSSYSEASTFLYMIDMSNAEGPKAAGVIRLIEPSEKGLKTLNTLSKTNEMINGKPTNPWYDDFTQKIEGFAEASQDERKQLIYDFFGVDPGKTWDIPTMAVAEGFRGHGLGLTPAWGLHAACMQIMPELGAESIIDTQDVAPLKLMQRRFKRPWTDEKTLDENGTPGKYGFSEVPFDGDAPVVPTSMKSIQGACENLKAEDPNSASLLFDVNTYGSFFKTPKDLQQIPLSEAA